MSEVNSHEKFKENKCVFQLMKRNFIGEIETGKSESSPVMHHRQMCNIMNQSDDVAQDNKSIINESSFLEVEKFITVDYSKDIKFQFSPNGQYFAYFNKMSIQIYELDR